MSLNKLTDETNIKTWMKLGADKINCNGMTAVSMETDDHKAVNMECENLTVSTRSNMPVEFSPYSPDKFNFVSGSGAYGYIGNMRMDFGTSFILSGSAEFDNFQTVAFGGGGTNQSYAVLEIDIPDRNMNYPLASRTVGGAVSVACTSSVETFGCNAICQLVNANKLRIVIYVDGVATQIPDASRLLFINYFLNLGNEPY